MKQLILFLVICLISAASNAQDSTATVRGMIISETTGEPIFYARVLLFDEDSIAVQGAYSDFDGIFILRNLKPGSYYLEIEEMGHQSIQVEVPNLEQNRIRTEKIYLKEKEKFLEEIQIRNPGYIQVDPSEIKRIPNKNQ